MKTVRQLLIILTLLVSASTQSRLAYAASPSAEGQGLYFSYEQRLMISYALLAQGESPEAKRQIVGRLAAMGRRAIEKGDTAIEVENFNEFLKAYRGDWPNTNSLAQDLERIEARESRGLPRYFSSSFRVQNKIDHFIRQQNEALFAMVKERFSAAPETEKQLLTKAMNSFSELFAEKLQSQNQGWGEKVLDLAGSLSESIIAKQIHELETLGEKISQSNLTSQKDPVAKIVLETLLNGYFTGLGMSSKKLLLSSFLGSNLKATDLEKFEILVQNSGPQLQKLLQVVSRQGDLDPEMKTIFQKLENSVREVPWIQVTEILAQDRGNYDFIYFERKPLGVGSMAQVHRAKIRVNGARRDVVVRFLKPGIAERVQEDDRILKGIAAQLDANPILRENKFPKISKMVSDVTRTVTDELDQKATVSRQVLAKIYERTVGLTTDSGYTQELKIKVPDVIAAKNPGPLMVQEMVIGAKLDKEYLKFKDEIPELKKAVVEKLAEVWLKEALFGSGFYHSDLHQGNFMLRIAEPNPELTILDYGMAGVLSKELQREVIALGAGFRGLDEKMIAKGFWAISEKDKNSVSFQDFEAQVNRQVEKIRARIIPVPTTNEWILWSVEKGLHPSYDFISLNRGNAILGSMLLEVGSDLSIDAIVEKLARRHPVAIYRALQARRDYSFQSLMKMALSPAKAPARIAPVLCEKVFTSNL